MIISICPYSLPEVIAKVLIATKIMCKDRAEDYNSALNKPSIPLLCETDDLYEYKPNHHFLCVIDNSAFEEANKNKNFEDLKNGIAEGDWKRVYRLLKEC